MNKLPCFPPPNPDELFYSICARYHARAGNIYFKNTMGDLFGSQNMRINYNIPSRLQNMYESLPDGSLNTPERMINYHTLFPIYRPFLPVSTAKNILNWMKREKIGNKTQMKLGITASRIKQPAYLRFCPDCILANEEKYGEHYLHRSHQFAGVRLCYKHQINLIDSEIQTAALNTTNAFEALNQVPKIIKPRKAGNDKNTNHWLDVAQSVHWILNNDVPCMGLEEIRRRYIQYLYKQGFATYSGHLMLRKLHHAFLEFYGKNLLRQLNCIIDISEEHNWLTELVRRPRNTSHPLYHILLMGFLGLTPEDFFGEEREDIQPFGKPPYPCLNPAAPHYRKSVIRECKITRNTVTGAPVGNFNCSCGFCYARTGPDKDESDKYRISRMISFGPVWEAELLNLVKREGKSFRETAFFLDVSTKTVIRHWRRITGNEVRLQTAELPTDDGKERLRSYRKSLLETIEQFPKKTRTELRRLIPGVYAWLYRYDHDWLFSHLPPARPAQKYGDNRVDWRARDAELEEKIILAIRDLTNENERPIRTTKTLIGKKTGAPAIIQNNIRKLPKCKTLLGESCETIEEFQMRRVRWVTKQMRQRGGPLDTWRIIRNSGLRPGFSNRMANEIKKLVEQGTGLI